MFWDKAASFYDLFENLYNRKVYRETGIAVAKEIRRMDEVLECACGTGAISVYIAPACGHLIATDFSEGMLKQTAKKVRAFENVEVAPADIMHLPYADARFDAVVAGNVIHLLDDPVAALNELMRVCRPGGRLILPTYINSQGGEPSRIVKLLEKAGAHFKRQFDLEGYRSFFADRGFRPVSVQVVEGRMSCAIAVITKAP